MRTPTVAVLILRDNKILLVKHGSAARHLNGVYGLPSGRIEAGETEKQAAVRELGEESGLTCNEDDLVEFPGNYYETTLTLKNGPEDFSWRVFLCQKYLGEIREANDETAPEWTDISKLNELNLLPNVQNAIDAAKTFLNLASSLNQVQGRL